MITVVILTYNESPNIGRCLDQLVWVKRIIVVDSFSTDATLEIASRFPQVEIFQRAFDDHASQWNYGLSLVRSEWVLSLDADYILGDEVSEEIRNAETRGESDVYEAKFKYCVFGKPLRSTLLPPRKVLFKSAKANYFNDGHTQQLAWDGPTVMLKGVIHHDDRKAFSRWYESQKKYAVLESNKLCKISFSDLNPQDKLRRMIFFAPIVVVLYCLLVKGMILDGFGGWFYVFQRWIAEALLSLCLLQRLSRKRV